MHQSVLWFVPRKRTSIEDETQHGPGTADHDQCSQVKIPRVPQSPDSDDVASPSSSPVDPSAKEWSSEDPMPTDSDSDDDNSIVADDPTANGAPASREPNATYDHYHTTSIGGHSLDIGLIIKPGITINEISTVASALSRREMYELLFMHVSPPAFLRSTKS
jgi:hypothetical protein